MSIIIKRIRDYCSIFVRQYIGIFFYIINNNTWILGTVEQCWTEYPTRLLCSIVRYPGQHSQSISYFRTSMYYILYLIARLALGLNIYHRYGFTNWVTWKSINNLWGKHKVNQYHGSDKILLTEISPWFSQLRQRRFPK